MSTRALLWLASLALLTHAWIARPWGSPPGPAGSPAPPASPHHTAVASAPRDGVLAELRVGDWTLSLRRQPTAARTAPTPPPRIT